MEGREKRGIMRIGMIPGRDSLEGRWPKFVQTAVYSTKCLCLWNQRGEACCNAAPAVEVWAWLRYLGDGSDSNAEDHSGGAAAETQSQQVRLDRKETQRLQKET